MGDSNCQSTELSQEAVFISLWQTILSGMFRDGNVVGSPDKSLVGMMLGSALLVCWLIFHSVSLLLLNKKSAINKMYFCNFHVYIWYISTNGQL